MNGWNISYCPISKLHYHLNSQLNRTRLNGWVVSFWQSSTLQYRLKSQLDRTTINGWEVSFWQISTLQYRLNSQPNRTSMNGWEVSCWQISTLQYRLKLCPLLVPFYASLCKQIRLVFGINGHGATLRQTPKHGCLQTNCILTTFSPFSALESSMKSRLRLKYDGTRAETRFRLSAKRTSPFKSAGLQFSRLLAAELFASALVMLNTPCSEVVWRVLAAQSIRQFLLHFPSRSSPCAIAFQLDWRFSGTGYLVTSLTKLTIVLT